MCSVHAVAVSLILQPAYASAQSIEDARAAFADGRFLEAADLGEALGTSDGYTLAAQALAVYAHYEAADEEWDEVIERAMRIGEDAVRADSTNPEAHCQYAHAVGRYAQRVGTFTALRKGLAGKVRDALEAALAIDPDYPGAHLTLGGWHADVAEAGFFARRIYGANREEAVHHYERALELVPDSKILLYEYGIRLPELDEDGGRERARAMLEKALGLPVRDAYEDYIHLDILDGLDALAGLPTQPSQFTTRNRTRATRCTPSESAVTPYRAESTISGVGQYWMRLGHRYRAASVVPS